MAQPIKHKKVKLIVGFIFSNEEILRKAESLITKRFGPIDYQSQVMDFSHTDYYQNEFGKNLKRKFISLRRLLDAEKAFRTKLTTNEMERKLSKSGRRRINIDPGYLTEGKLVLLTTKDYGHRVYLRDGIYGESTLIFHKGTYAPRDTTYPDYRSDEYIKAFNNIRLLYKEQLGKDEAPRAYGSASPLNFAEGRTL